MKKLATFIIGFCILQSFSCETDHYSEKYLLNLSDHTLQISRVNTDYYSIDTWELAPLESIIVENNWNWGNREEQNLPSCILEEIDSVTVVNLSDSTLIFTGGFTNEERWRSEFTGGRSSSQTCTFAFVNNDFVD